MHTAWRTAAYGLALSLVIAEAAFANQVNVFWVGPPSGSWSVATNWLPPIVPQNGGGTEYAAVVDLFGAQFSVAIVDQPFVSQQVFTNFGDTVHVKDGRSLRLTSGYIKNQGTMVIDGEEDVTELVLDGVPYLDTNGTMRLDGTGFARLRTGAATAALTNSSQHTVRGNGTIDVHGAGLFNGGTIIAGAVAAPHGGLAIELGAADQCTNAGVMTASLGDLAVNGGTLINSGILTVDATHALTRDGTLSQIAGELRVDGATSSALVVSAAGGIVSGTGQIHGLLTCGAAAVAPGGAGATGTLTIGDLTCSAQTTLELELAPSEHDVLHVTGDAQFSGGTVKVLLLGGVLPAPNSEFEILQVDGAIEGVVPTAESCPPASLIVEAHTLILRFDAVSEMIGDLNGDGAVSGVDLAILIAHWGACTSDCCTGDIDGDGVIDSHDLAALLADW